MMRMQATRVIKLVLFSVMIVVMQLSRDSLVVAQENNSSHMAKASCPAPKCESKATHVDTVLSIIGVIASAFVMVSPGVRVFKWIEEQENLVKDRCFMAFLGIVTIDYCAWVRYSLLKCYCDATIYMFISSVIGVVVSGLYFFTGLLKDIGRAINQGEKMVFVFLFISMGLAFLFGDHINGYAVMIGTFAAHVCRVLSTDYTCFSRAQFIVSLVGAAGGFLTIWHPHLTKARPFHITSFVLAWIRVVELVWWVLLYVFSLPKVRDWLQVLVLIRAA